MTLFRLLLANSSEQELARLTGLCILAQNDEAAAEKSTKAMRGIVWVLDPTAHPKAADRDNELKNFDKNWTSVAELVKDRKLKVLQLAGIDRVLLWDTEDWYYSGLSAEGPVLIKISVEFFDNTMWIHGVKVWSSWEQVKEASRAIQFMGTMDHLYTITYGQTDGQSGATTRPSEVPNVK